MIKDLVGAISSLNSELTAEEIADIIWLALKIEPNPSSQERANEILKESCLVTTKEGLHSALQKPKEISSEKHKGYTNLYVDRPRSVRITGNEVKSKVGISGLDIRVPTAKALPDSLSIAKAFYPFMQRVASKKDFIFDEESTVERIIDENICVPVLRPALSRWFSLSFLVDTSESMIIWQKTIDELMLLIEREGAFRNIETYFFSTDKETVEIYKTPIFNIQKPQKRNIKEIIRPNDPHVILVISDCVATAWHNGQSAKLINDLGKSNLVTIIQLLPKMLWQRTSLSEALMVKFSNPFIEEKNKHIKCTPLNFYDKELSYSIPIPIVTLTSTVMRTWAKSITGIKGVWSRGVKLLLNSEAENYPEIQVKQGKLTTEKISAKELLDNFYSVASPLARRLVVLLSTIPFDFSLVRLVRQTLLPQANQEHLAEVFLSGLIEKVQFIEAPAMSSGSKMHYDFVEGVRPLLLNSLKKSDMISVFKQISTYLEKNLGQPMDFLAMVEDPSLVSELQINGVYLPFATIAAGALKRFGGKYEKLAERIESKVEKILIDHEQETDYLPKAKKTVSTAQQEASEEQPIRHYLHLAAKLESEATNLLNLAIYEEAKQKYAEVLNIYDQLIKDNLFDEYVFTNKGIALQNLGRLKMYLSDYNEALSCYEEAIKVHNMAIELNSIFAAAYNNKGLALQYIGDLEVNRTRYLEAQDYFYQSIETISRAISLEPNLMPAHTNKGNSFSRLGHLTFQLSKYGEAERLYLKSLSSYDRAIALSPKRADLYNNKSVVLESIAKLKNELSEYDEALRICDQAINLTNSAISLEPNSISAYNNKGISLSSKSQILFWLGEYSEALSFCQASLDVYEKALSIAPNYIEAHSNKAVELKLLGDIYRHLSMLEKSSECYTLSLSAFNAALQLSPNDIDTQSNKADVLFKEAQLHVTLSNFEKAIECFLESIRIHDASLSSLPNSLSILTSKGLSLKELGNLYSTLSRFEDARVNLDSAIEIFASALQISENFIPGYSNLGLAFHSLAELRSILTEHNEAIQTYEKSMDAYDKGLKLAPNFVPILYNKAITLIRKGELEFALSEHNRALQSYDLAIDFCDKALNVAPKCLPALSNKAVALSVKAYLQKQLLLFNESLNNYNLAVKIMDNIINITPNADDTYSNKGNELACIAELYDLLDDRDSSLIYYEESIKTFEQALMLQNTVAALSGKATTLSKYGLLRGKLKQYAQGKENFEDAIKIIDQAIKLAPNDPRLHYNKGNILISFGDFHKMFSNLLAVLSNYEDVIKCYDKQLEVAPNSIQALNNKAYTMQKIVEVIFLLTNSPQTVSFVNPLLRVEKYCVQAKDIYDRILRDNPKNIKVLRNKMFIMSYLGQTKAFQRKKEEARKIYKYCLPIVNNILKTTPTDEQMRELKKNISYLLGELKKRK